MVLIVCNYLTKVCEQMQIETDNVKLHTMTDLRLYFNMQNG